MTTTHEFSVVVKKAEEILSQPYARIILPESDGTFRGEIMEFPGCIATGETAAATLSTLEDAAKSWLMAAIERGQTVPAPVESSNDFSGRLVLRIPKSLHKKAAWIAEREGVSLNYFITTSLSESVGERSKPTTNIVFASTSVNYVPVGVHVGASSLLGGAPVFLGGSQRYITSGIISGSEAVMPPLGNMLTVGGRAVNVADDTLLQSRR